VWLDGCWCRRIVIIIEIKRTARCCSETKSVTAQICSGRNQTEPHTQIHASCRGSLTPQSLRILTTDLHPHSPHRLPAAAVCPIHLSLASWVTEEQLTAAAAEHGHGVIQIQHVRQNYTIASAHCAQRVSLPSAELELVIRVSPRLWIFGSELSASVRGSQEFLRIGVRRLLWPSTLRPRRVARQHDGHLMPPRTCHHTQT